MVRGNLDGGTFKLQLDIGIDDAVVPDPEWVEYPTLLDLDAPRILAYQPVTALPRSSRRCQQGARQQSASGLLRHLAAPHTAWLHGAGLAALGATFAHRGTTLPTDVPPG